jgi:intracellular multiplication protein IcmL
MANVRRNSFYKEYYHSIITGVVVSIFLMLAMVSFILYQIYNRPLPQFNAIAPSGNVMALESFQQPNLLPSTIIKWASKAAVAAYTFDFVNYNKQIAAARPYFTPSGWSDYQASVYKLLQDIAQKQLFVNSVVSGTPVISNQGILPGTGYVWRVQLPFLVTYQSSERVSRQHFYVMMTIVKVSTREDPTGIGIDQFIMR